MCINTIRTHHIELGTQATISMNNTHTHPTGTLFSRQMALK